MKKKLLFLILLLSPLPLLGQYTVSGYVFESKNREALVGVTVFDSTSSRGAATNAFGFFSLTLPEPVVRLRFSYIGFETQFLDVDLRDSPSLEVFMEEQAAVLDGLTITAGRYTLSESVESVRMGVVALKPDEVTTIPAFAGEADLLKVMQLMPGVTRGNEGTTGMYVRGGADDQNMVLLDDAVVYNTGHLFGFFSVFNTDAIKDVQMTKGSFPARQGGRLSSVTDIRMKDGSMEQFNATGGIGLLTSRITLDGPIIPGRMRFMAAGRRTYIDQVLKLAGADLPYYFYDVNAKVNYNLSNRDRFYVSAYLGRDILAFTEEQNNTQDAQNGSNGDNDEDWDDLGFGFGLGNVITTIRWNHVYRSGRMFSNVTAHQTAFDYDVNGRFSDNSVFLNSKIQDYGLKADWDYFPAPGHQVQFGAGFVTHLFRPNVISTSGDISELIESSAGERLVSTEGALYASHDWQISRVWRVEYGLRYSGAATGVFYHGPEPRFSMRFLPLENHSFKLGYSMMRQYMHRVSSSAIALPTDLWYPVTRGVEPQSARQLAIGYFGAIPDRGLTFSTEVYVKRMYNLIEYKEGANLILNDRFEEELLPGDGRSTGAEFMLRKHTGRFTGWGSYTLSRTRRHFDGLNRGVSYPDKYDRRHSVSLVGMMDLTSLLSFSFSWVYMSGSRITAQTGQFLMPNPSLTGIDLLPVYSDRNAEQLASTHRLDVNFILRRPERRFGQGEWHFSMYNFYNRASPYRVSITSNGKSLEYVQTGLFGFLPSISYNFNLSYP